MMEIASLKNPKIIFLKKCLNPHFAEKNDCFILTDLSLINEADKHHLIKQIFTYESSTFNNAYLVKKEIFKSLKINSPIIAIVKKINAGYQYTNKVIYLDAVSDPTNLGKIIYLMHKYHYRDLILSPNSVSLYNKKCLAIAKHYIFDLAIHYGDILELVSLKKQGYQILATGLKSSEFLANIKHKDKYVLIFGNEARGVHSNILKISDNIIRINIKNIDSLNIASAVSIVLDHIKRYK